MGRGTKPPGEGEAEFSWFYRAEYANVARSVFLILQDRQRGEEIAQDAFIQLYARWWKISRYQRPEAWVRRVAIRMAMRHLRRERMRRSRESPERRPVFPSPVDVDLFGAIRELTAPQRAVVVLFYFEDRPIAEIAESLGSSIGAVKMALQRARHRLAELLTEEVDDVDRP